MAEGSAPLRHYTGNGIVSPNLTLSANMAPSSSGKDIALSRRKADFNYPWGYQNGRMAERLMASFSKSEVGETPP